MLNPNSYFQIGFWDCRRGRQSLASTLVLAGETEALDFYVKGWYKANEFEASIGCSRRPIELYWEFNL